MNSENHIFRIHLLDFVEREQNPKDEFGKYDFECIEAIDTDLLNNHILKLKNPHSSYKYIYIKNIK